MALLAPTLLKVATIPSFNSNRLETPEAICAIATVIIKQLKWQENKKELRQYLFQTLAPHIVRLDLSGMDLSTEIVKDIGRYCTHLHTLYASESLLDGKAITTDKIFPLLPEQINIITAYKSNYPGLHKFDSHIKRALNGTFGKGIMNEKDAWGNQFPALLIELEKLTAFLNQPQKHDEKKSEKIEAVVAKTLPQASTVEQNAKREMRKLRQQKEKEEKQLQKAQQQAQAKEQELMENEERKSRQKIAALTQQLHALTIQAPTPKAAIQKDPEAEKLQHEKRLRRQLHRQLKTEERKQKELEAEKEREAEEKERELMRREEGASLLRHHRQLRAQSKKVQNAPIVQTQEKKAPEKVEPELLMDEPTILDYRRKAVVDAQFAVELQFALGVNPFTTTLRLPQCTFSKEIAQVIQRHGKIDSLDISLCKSVDPAAIALLQPYIKRLTTTVSGENLGKAWKPYHELMKILQFTGEKLLPPGAQHFTPFPCTRTELESFSKLTELEHLDLVDGQAFDEHGAHYISSLRSLKSLIVNHCRLNAAGIKKLAPIQQLEELALMMCETLGDEGFDAIATQFTGLQRLALATNNLTDVSLEKIGCFSKLHSLLIGFQDKMNDNAYKNLVQLKATLQYLAITTRKINSHVMLYLITHLPDLKFLRLYVESPEKVPEKLKQAILHSNIHEFEIVALEQQIFYVGRDIKQPHPEAKEIIIPDHKAKQGEKLSK